MPRIVRFHAFGGPDVLRIEELPPQVPGPGEARIRVKAFALNRADLYFRQNLYLSTPALPSRLGYDAAGVVDAVGDGVTSVAVGDRVCTLPAQSCERYGVYGEEAVLPATSLFRYPEALSPEEAAALGVQYFTGYFALFELGGLGAGDCALVTAASSSTGVAAIQLAKAAGAQVLATTRTETKKGELERLGADRVIVTAREKLPEVVAAFTDGAGVKVVFDPIGGKMLKHLVESTADRGTIVVYGLLDMSAAVLNMRPFLGRSIVLRGYRVFEFTGNPELGLVPRPVAVERARQFLTRQIAERGLRPVLARTFPLEEVAVAHRYMESNTQVGKIVVTA